MPPLRLVDMIMSALLALLAVPAAPAAAGPAQLPGDVAGFAGQVEGGTNEVMFDDLDSLRRCLAAPGNLCVPRAAMTIAPGLKRLMVAGSVTLDGKGLLALQCDSYCLELRQGDNVVRGVRLAGPGPTRTLWPARFPDANCTNPALPKNVSGCAVPIHMIDARRVLIEGNDFATCGNKCLAIDGGDEVTVRRNRFADSYFGILAVANAANGPFSRLTVAGNVFTRIFRRSARVSGRFVLHETGNLLSGHCPDLAGGGFGVSAVGDAQALVEGNFAEPDACAAIQISDAAEGKPEARGRIMSRSNAGIEDRADAVDFEVPYAHPAARPDAAVRAAIERAAGVH
jgi:hypothetical protein